MNVALDQAQALVGLRFKQWLRRITVEKAWTRLVTLGLAFLIGGVLSIVLAVGIWAAVQGLLSKPGALAEAGGARTLIALWLTFGALLRVYLALVLIAQGRSLLDPRRFLVYAVSPRLVTAVNVVAQLVEPAWLFFYLPLASLAVFGARLPGAPGVLALLFAEAVLLLCAAALVHFFAALFAEMSARPWLRRTGLLLIFVAIFSAQYRRDLRHLALDGVTVWKVLAWLPTGWAASLAGALSSHSLWPALWELFKFAALSAVAVALGHTLSLREARREPETVRASAPSAARPRMGWRLPFLADPVSGLIEKELKTLLRAGWLQLLMAPLLFMLLRASPGQRAQMGAQPLLVAAAYAHLGVLAFLTNVFGFDADGARGYFLWPVRGRVVMASKNAVSYLVSLAMFVVFAVAVKLDGGLTGEQLLLGFIAHLATFPAAAALGNFASIYFPAPMRTARTRRSPGTAANSMRVLALVPIALGAWAPWQLAKLTGRFLLALYLGELVVMAVVYGGVLSASEALLEARRDRLLHALARDE